MGAALRRRPAWPWLIEGFAVFYREAVPTPSTILLHAALKQRIRSMLKSCLKGASPFCHFFTRGCQTLKIVNVNERKST
jgi:hypothetical protein